MIHTVKCFSRVNKAEVISGVPLLSLWSSGCWQFFTSSAFSKPSLYIRKCSVHVLLKRSMKDFEHNLTSMWEQHPFPFYRFPLFLCIVYVRRPSYLSLLFSETLLSIRYVFFFLPCLSLFFFPQVFVKPTQTTTLPSWISFSLGWFWFLWGMDFFCLKLIDGNYYI